MQTEVKFFMKCSLLWGFLLFAGTIHAESLHPIRINGTDLAVEMAATDAKRARGLMGRSSLAEGTGMLFIFERPHILSFWMKNTTIPLSIGFFDEQGCLINIENMAPPKNNELPVYQSKKPALYAIEVPLGWFERHHIQPPMGIEEIPQKHLNKRDP
jgi:uncharacterized protein